MSNAQKLVLSLLIGIAVLELSLTGKIGKIWTLAFTTTTTSGQSSGG